eukprot:scaffold1503_cov250-Pinguiococcus_pyrenoidosus.AAC.17
MQYACPVSAVQTPVRTKYEKKLKTSPETLTSSPAPKAIPAAPEAAHGANWSDVPRCPSIKYHREAYLVVPLRLYVLSVHRVKIPFVVVRHSAADAERTSPDLVCFPFSPSPHFDALQRRVQSRENVRRGDSRRAEETRKITCDRHCARPPRIPQRE